jgi:hypothetical protein
VEKIKEVVQLSGLVFRRLLTIGPMNRPCSLTGGAESANLSITLNNDDGFLTEFFRMPPHRVKTLVSGYYNGKRFELFRGVISGIYLASEIRLDMER